MKTRLRMLLFLLLGVGLAGGTEALGQPSWESIDLNDVLPFGESSVRSLAVLPDGSVLGGSGGAAAHLFLFDPATQKVRDLKRWPRFAFVRNLTLGAEGRFWMILGSEPGAILSDQVPAPEERLFSGVWAEGKLTLKDHGIPFAGEGIQCITLDQEGRTLYGMTRPTPILFRYDLAQEGFEELGRLGERESFEHARTWRAPVERVSRYPHVLTMAPGGEIYGASGGSLIRWEPPAPDAPETDEPVETLSNMKVPAAQDRMQSTFGPSEGIVVESWTWGPEGRLYGGTYDGYLFAADLAAEKIINLGKPFRQAHIRALTTALDGRIFGLCGEVTGRCRLFSYAPGDGYREEGPGGFQGDTLDALALAPDGRIYIGSGGRMTALYIRQPPPDQSGKEGD